MSEEKGAPSQKRSKRPPRRESPSDEARQALARAIAKKAVALAETQEEIERYLPIEEVVEEPERRSLSDRVAQSGQRDLRRKIFTVAGVEARLENGQTTGAEGRCSGGL